MKPLGNQICPMLGTKNLGKKCRVNMKLNHRVAIPTEKTVNTEYPSYTFNFFKQSSSNQKKTSQNLQFFWPKVCVVIPAFPPCDLLISRILLPAARRLDRAVGEDVDADPSSGVGHAAHHALIVTFAVLCRWSKLVGA